MIVETLAGLLPAAKGLMGLGAVKGVLATKGAVSTNTALVASQVSTSNGGTSLLAMMANKVPAFFGSATLSSGGTTATQGTTSLISPTGFGSFLSTLTSNVLPFGSGAAGGGATAWLVTQRKSGQVEARLDEQAAQTTTQQAEIERLQEQLSVAEAQLSALQAAVATRAAQAGRIGMQFSLEEIVGIGPVYAERLDGAGIRSFGDLAALTPEQVMAIVSPSGPNPLIDIPDWIAQARQLANEGE